MSMRFTAAINKPGFNPLGTQTTTLLYNLFGWGSNANGELGLGNTTNYSSPKQIGSLTSWVQIAAGYKAISAVKTDGTLWTWGSGQYGGLGLGNTTSYSSPKQVGALTNWLKIANGYGCIGSIKTDGTLWTWGSPASYGQLGLGNVTYYSSPKQVGALTNWSKIAFGGIYCGIGIKTDGTIWSWGYNGYGQLGIGNTTAYSSPKQIGAATNWSQVSAGYGFALAVKTDGTLWSWGKNNAGQLGLGTVGGGTYKSSPTQIGALTTWLNVSTAYGCSFAVKTDGTFWAWGANGDGRLGLGNSTQYSSPKQVGALTNWSKTYSSSYAGFCSAIKTDGTLWTWGQNPAGQLGLNNRTYYSSPKQVGSSTTWLLVAGAPSGLLALG